METNTTDAPETATILPVDSDAAGTSLEPPLSGIVDTATVNPGTDTSTQPASSISIPPPDTAIETANTTDVVTSSSAAETSASVSDSLLAALNSARDFIVEIGNRVGWVESAALILSILALLLAWNAHKQQKARFRTELLDKRYKVFYRIREFIAGIVSGEQITKEDVDWFEMDTTESAFLFRRDLNRYLDEIIANSRGLAALHEKLDELAEDQQGSLLDDITAKTAWFTQQPPHLKRRFRRYLRIGRLI